MMNPMLRLVQESLGERAFLGGQAVSMIGDGLAVLAIPLLVMQLTRSPLAAVLASLPSATLPLASRPGCWPTGPIPGSC